MDVGLTAGSPSSESRGPTSSEDAAPALGVNVDLLTRIRSLLISRNGHQPPTTPWPSPELSLSGHPRQSLSIPLPLSKDPANVRDTEANQKADYQSPPQHLESHPPVQSRNRKATTEKDVRRSPSSPVSSMRRSRPTPGQSQFAKRRSTHGQSISSAASRPGGDDLARQALMKTLASSAKETKARRRSRSGATGRGPLRSVTKDSIPEEAPLVENDEILVSPTGHGSAPEVPANTSPVPEMQVSEAGRPTMNTRSEVQEKGEPILSVQTVPSGVNATLASRLLSVSFVLDDVSAAGTVPPVLPSIEEDDTATLEDMLKSHPRTNRHEVVHSNAKVSSIPTESPTEGVYGSLLVKSPAESRPHVTWSDEHNRETTDVPKVGHLRGTRRNGNMDGPSTPDSPLRPGLQERHTAVEGFDSMHAGSKLTPPVTRNGSPWPLKDGRLSPFAGLRPQSPARRHSTPAPMYEPSVYSQSVGTASVLPSRENSIYSRVIQRDTEFMISTEPIPPGEYELLKTPVSDATASAAVPITPAAKVRSWPVKGTGIKGAGDAVYTNWFRQVLRRTPTKEMPGSSPANLTARPSQQTKGVERRDSNWAAFVSDTPVQQPVSVPVQAVEPTDEPSNPESFAKVIVDLEGLLNEALHIARQAAEDTDGSALALDHGSRNQGAVEFETEVFSQSRGDALPQSAGQLRQRAASVRIESSSRGSASSYTSGNSSGDSLYSFRNRQQSHMVIGLEATRPSIAPVGSRPKPNRELTYLETFVEALRATPDSTASGVTSARPSIGRPASRGNFPPQDAVRHSWSSSDNESVADLEDNLTSYGFPGPRLESVDRGITHPSELSVATSPRGPFQFYGGFNNRDSLAISPSQTPGIESSPTTRQRKFSVPRKPALRQSVLSSHFALPEEDESSMQCEGKADVHESKAAPTNSPGVDVDLVLDAFRPSGYEKHEQIELGPIGQAAAPTEQESAQAEKGLAFRARPHLDSQGGSSLSSKRRHRRRRNARVWSVPRKRFAASVACMNTAFVGLVAGIYAGEMPAIRGQIVDQHYYTVLANVLLYIGLAIPTLLFWPLPLLHGRKAYTLGALSVVLPVQLAQAIVVDTPRSPAPYRVILLLLARALAGLVLGLANINFKATLLDLFGTSFQSDSSSHHQHLVLDEAGVDLGSHDGGGLGLWLGIWSWCYIGSLGVGFLIGALVIGGDVNPVWGFWLTILVAASVLFLNVLVPDVRRPSSTSKILIETFPGSGTIRRVPGGEVMIHVYSTTPSWWWDEARAGIVLCGRMLSQLGFTILVLYLAWLYAQIVMLMALLGALTSNFYRLQAQHVGLCVLAIPVGAFLALPFQKDSWFSRSSGQDTLRTDGIAVQDHITWTPSLARRAVSMLLLPFADLAYTLSSSGPPTHFILPTLFAGLIGFLSNVAIAECHALIMETYDVSDIAPETRLDRHEAQDKARTTPRASSYTCFPRVSAAFAIAQASAFLLAAVSTGVGGVVLQRRSDVRIAAAVMAGVQLLLTVVLEAVLWRWKEVQLVPHERLYELPAEDYDAGVGRLDMLGGVSGKTRRMNLLEMGGLSRWMEIRRRNGLG